MPEFSVTIFAFLLNDAFEACGEGRNELFAFFSVEFFELTSNNSLQTRKVFRILLIDYVLHIAKDIFYHLYQENSLPIYYWEINAGHFEA